MRYTQAKHSETDFDFSAQHQEIMECWDYSLELECLNGNQDLQLAAELGKTLLARNKELELTLKQQGNTIKDQEQEICYLQKQTAALREVSDSRLRIYEQLDVNIQELERTNHRLACDNASEKKNKKTLCDRIENLETKCEELTRQVDETQSLVEIERRKNDRLTRENQSSNTLKPNESDIPSPGSKYSKSPSSTGGGARGGGYDTSSDPETDQVDSRDSSTMFQSRLSSSPKRSKYINRQSQRNGESTDDRTAGNNQEENDAILNLMGELESSKKQCLIEEQKVAELEEQLIAYIQENQAIHGRLAQINTNDEMKSVHEELSILEEVRQGQMCNRCLRTIDDNKSLAGESSVMGGGEDQDDNSIMELLQQQHKRHQNTDDTNMHDLFGPAIQIKDSKKPDLLDLHTPNPNPYRELVEKYEALLEVQRVSMIRNRNQAPAIHLQDEIQTSGEFSSINTKFTDDEFGRNGINHSKICSGGGGAQRKTNLRTPTDFSEADSASSGFSDETSNKATQTEERFLLTIADGEDCKLSIYDDANPIDSRFRNRPEYRELFKEIFGTLKKAGEQNDEDVKEQQQLRQDTESPILNESVSKAPPATPANSDLPDFNDDLQSIISSSAVSEQSVAMSERITKTERKKIEAKGEKNGQENKPPKSQYILEDGRVLTPLKRQPLEYLSVSVNLRKKSKKNRRNVPNESSGDVPAFPSPTRMYANSSAKKRRDMRPFNQALLLTPPTKPTLEWNGNSMTIYNRTMSSTNSNESPSPKIAMEQFTEVHFKPSPASQDLQKLKKLDLSYAEVLRRADHSNKHLQHRRK